MKVAGIFKILATIVVCLALCVLILNTIMPNMVTQGVTAIETTIKNGTGFEFDLDGNGNGAVTPQAAAGKASTGAAVTEDVTEF